MLNINTIADIMYLHKGYWFDPALRRFHGTRIGKNYGRVFVTSERFIPHDGPSPQFPRLYSVRCLLLDGSITTVGEFQQYRTARAANLAALNLARWLGEVGGHRATIQTRQ